MEYRNQMGEIAFVRELMKGGSEGEIQEAEERFREYLILTQKIAARLEEQEKQGICHIEDHKEGMTEIECELFYFTEETPLNGLNERRS